MRIAEFRKRIWAHYRRAGRRHLPWNRTRDPYQILAAEVMLQQTQVLRVLKKYPEFLKAFPDFSSLEKAPTSRVLKVWQGMGYNRRALFLKRLAEIVVKQYGGKLPKDQKELAKLPGIGMNSAGSIAAAAYNYPSVFIETNIRRVFIHFFFPVHIHKNMRVVRDNEIMPLIEQTLDRKNPREWYWALMDYGAMLGRTVKNPNRRSAHYTRQAKFHGSSREMRGRVIKKMLQKDRVTFSELIAETGTPAARLETILAGLESEGFIVGRKGIYTLKR